MNYCLFASKQGLLFESHALFEGVNIIGMGVNIVRIRILARIVIDRRLDFDQMILYPNFIHLSYTLERANRKQILYSKDYYGPKLYTL